MSAPAPYLLHVTSRPTQVSLQTWKKWYASEHLPDLVGSGTSIRATLYEEIDLPGATAGSSERRFLAMYQTPFETCLEKEQYRGLRTTSGLFEKDGAGSSDIEDNGDFNARNYGLIQVFDPKGLGESPPPEILTAEAQPADPDDYDAWFRTEHMDQLAALPGYRRTLRYKLGPRTALTKGEDVPLFLAVHEVEDAGKWMAGRAEAAKTATPSEWAVRNVRGCRVFRVRGWRLVHGEGH
ncbi:putative alpha/beta hydrolase [Paraphaeosphaeria minitans]|uniref:Alpha/beta hydrolase n=1 Tax=Paraphaeosphaeria minitans TaxID=565426 RepID=A0A9P6GH71_9PLEO|nr:putative alpha/beta hydrolase [Paraphaeosphaeria minitans]